MKSELKDIPVTIPRSSRIQSIGYENGLLVIITEQTLFSGKLEWIDSKREYLLITNHD